MLHAYLSTCPECFFPLALVTGVLVKPRIIFRLGMSFSCGENWRVKHSNCVHLNGRWRTPPPSQMWEVQRWRSAVTAHREKPTWPPILARPITKLLAWQLFPGAHIFFKTKFVTFSNLWSVQRYKSAKHSEIPDVKSKVDCLVTINFSTTK